MTKNCHRDKWKLWLLIAIALAAIQGLAQSVYQPYTFTTLAGGGGFSSPEHPGTALRFNICAGIALDHSGNLFVTDTFNHVIRKITPAGEITTLAGLPGIPGSADGTGRDARFYLPDHITVDGAGNIYVTQDAHTIRKVTPEGAVTTIAGLADHPGNTDGIGSVARFNIPTGIVLDGAGNLYVADGLNRTIRKLTPTGSDWVVTTIAGSGILGSANGTNRAARFNFPYGLTIDGAGSLYVADADNETIRKVTPIGTNWVVTTLAGQAGAFGFVDGTNSAARFNGPVGVAIDRTGTLYVAEADNHTIRQVTPIGTNWVVTTLAGVAANPGSADGIGNSARFNSPYSVAIDTAGNLYVADTFSDTVRKMTMVETNWVVSTVGGVGGNFGSTDGPGNVALFKGPAAVTVDSAGNTYVADQINHTIRKVTPAGEVTTLAGTAGYGGSANGGNSDARFLFPSGVAVNSAGNVYVADRYNATIRKMTPVGTNWAVTTLAGFPGSFGSADGIASDAQFSGPAGMAVDPAGNLYVADADAHTIRRVTPTRIVTTLAGNPTATDQFGNIVGGYADGTGSAAQFKWPFGVAVDAATNIYVADTFNHAIRKVTPARVVTTIAGQAGSPGSADGVGNAARFNVPSSIAVDGAGNVYVADTYNNTIRKLRPDGTNWVVTTLGGAPEIWGSADGRGSAARFSNPNGIAVDGSGNLYISDFYLNTIRKGYPPPRILNVGFNGGQFRFDLNGPTGQSVIVEASTNLVSWLPIWTNTFSGALSFGEPQSGAPLRRFFRVHVP
jgi:hypothetical protein